MKRISSVAFSLFTFAIISLTAFSSGAQPGPSQGSTPAVSATAPAPAQKTVPASGAPASSAPKVMSPDTWPGNTDALMGYGAAQKCPEICAKLFCWCGCDDTDGHKSLLDCYTSDHAADCTVCTGEAVMALKMKRAGKSIGEIQKCVDLTFAKLYPYKHPTPALVSYRASRLWKPTAAEARIERRDENSQVDATVDGAKRGNCCGAVHRK